MKIAELYKIILDQGFTPEVRKQIEEGTYSSKDIADLMETMAAGNSALEKRVAELEERLVQKQKSTSSPPDKKNNFLYTAGRITAGVACGSILVAVGMYVGKYVAAAEIGAAVSSFITVSSYFIYGGRFDDLPEHKRENAKMELKQIGSLGGIVGAICGGIAYGVIPLVLSELSADSVANILIKGTVGGIIGASLPIYFACTSVEDARRD